MQGDYITSIPREQQERRGSIRTFTGRYINPLKVRARDVCLEDVAHHLSIINRYTGASPWPLSVAQHSVMCAQRAQTQFDTYWPAYDATMHGRVHWPKIELGLWVSRRDWIAAHFLHDAGEYLFNDLASPVKRDPRMAWYNHQEHETTRMIFCTFGLDPDLLALTKPLDDACFFAEARSFWEGSAEVEHWPDYMAKREFLKMAESLNLKLIGGLQ